MSADVSVSNLIVDAPLGQSLECVLSHATRTALHSLDGFFDELAQQNLDDSGCEALSAARRCAHEILVANNRVVRVFDVLYGNKPVDEECFSMKHLLNEICTAANTDGHIVCEVADSFPEILCGDVDSLQNLVMELVRHALSSTPVRIRVELAEPTDSRSVRVRCCIEGDKSVGVVEGKGAPLMPWGAPDALDQIMIEGLIRRLGATLTVNVTEDEYLVQILDFQFNMNESIKKSAESLTQNMCDAVSSGTKDNSADPTRLKVLVVEDDEINIILIRQYMRRLGHDFDCVGEGVAAVRAALSGNYDVVLMDRHLPDIDGIEATKRLRTAESHAGRNQRIPVIAVTADVSRGHRERCLDAGMDDFISKPFDLDRLRDVLIKVTTGAPDRALIAETPDFDVSALRRLMDEQGCDSATMAEILRTYLDELPGNQMRLQLAVRRGSSQSTIAAAEHLRDSSEMVGAVKLAEVCSEIQYSVESGDLDYCEALLPTLRHNSQHTRKVLSAVEAALLTTA